jgi:phage shock protein E
MKLFGFTFPSRPQLDLQGAVLLDVRTGAEFAEGSAPGARNIPLQQLEARLRELPKGKKIVTFCRSGARSGSAAEILRRAGYQVENGGTVGAVRAALG